MADEAQGKRRPTDDDLPDLMLAISEGKSLRKACEDKGIDPPSAHHWLEADEDRRQQYARARALRSEFHADKGLEIGYAAASGQTVEINGEQVTIDPNGARVALDAIKWSTARMNPKGEPTKKVSIAHSFSGTDEELDERLAQLTSGDDEASAET